MFKFYPLRSYSLTNLENFFGKSLDTKDFYSSWVSEIFELPNVHSSEISHSREEKDGKLILKIELPGVEIGDLKLSYENKKIIIDCKKFEKQYHHELSVPNVNCETIKSILKNGILTITIDILKSKNVVLNVTEG